MKKILITGANSYIGTSFEQWMKQYDGYQINTVDTMDGKWITADFTMYDTVFHVAGIAHIKETKGNAPLYYKVNRDLAIEVAAKAKRSGIKQFILMSSMSVYGMTAGVITKDTVPTPKSNYGKSKLEADIEIMEMSDNNFKVAILRPPMIYGKGSKGNYPRLSDLAKKTPVFPSKKNQRSMLHIDNLCEFIKLMIDNNEHGIFYPQNREYIKTAELVRTISELNGKKVIMLPLFNPLLKLLSKRVTTFNKLFGNLVYDKAMSAYNDWSYCVNGFEESIRKTER